MDKCGKKKVEGLSQNNIEKMSLFLSQIENHSREAFGYLADAVAYAQLKNLVEDIYQLGKLKEIYEIFGGYVNRSFGVVVEKDGTESDYFVRKYKRGITDADIAVEHGLIAYAASNGMDTISRVFATPEGKTYVWLEECLGGETEKRAFAVYEFLRGEDRYSWIQTDLTPAEDRSFGELLASFHAHTNGFDPGEKAEPPILQLLPQLKVHFETCCKVLSPQNHFRKEWEKHLPKVQRIIDLVLAKLTEEESGMPVCPCHCDFHPGNVKWTGEKCTGVFDFDWSKLDKRLFDVAYAVLYICTSWESEDNGRVLYERIGNMLEGYQCYAKQSGTISAFTEAECRAFPYMMLAGAMYLLNWESTYCDDVAGLNEYEYFYYLSHTLNTVEDIFAHMDELEKIISGVCNA